jgi:hypothetical protein
MRLNQIKTTLNLCVITVFCHGVNDIFSILGFYAAQIGRLLQTFKDNQLVPFSRVSNPRRMLGTIRHAVM